MADINVTEEIININVTEDVINIVAPTGAYPLPNAVNSVFGRVGAIVALEGDYNLTKLSDVTLTSPSNGQVLKYNGTSWVNDSDAGITGSGTTNTLPKFTGASTIGNSNITDTGTAIALNSDTAIGTTTLAAATKLTLGGSQTAVSAIARGGLINSTLVASANSDVLVGLDINPTFTNGAFTGVNNIGLRVNGTIAATGVLTLNRNTSSTIIFADASETTIINTSFTARLAFRIGSTDYGRFFPTSGNFTLQNGGTYTDSGFRLDVTGTSRLNGQTTITGSTTAASALARGIIATPTLVAAANGDVLVGLDINTTYTLGAFTSVKTMGLRVDGINIGRGSGNIGTNTAIGASALENNTTGAQNTALGGIALRNTTTGGFNTAIGYNSLTVNSTGSENVAIGRNAGEGNTTSSNNTYIGTNAASFNTTGSSNTFIGHNAGRFITGGSTANTISNNSIFIGQDCRAAADNQSNQIVIGRATTGLGTNTTIIGTTATTITGLYGNIRLVSGMGTAPATSTSTGTTGDIVVTAGFIYVCSATNTWVRTILTTF